MLPAPRTDPDERSSAHPVLITDEWRRSERQERDGALAVEEAIAEPILKEARPVGPVFLAPSANGTPPESKRPIAEHSQTREVSRYRVVVKVALDDRLEPLSGLGHGIVHALAQLLLNLSQLGSHALADRRAPHQP